MIVIRGRSLSACSVAHYIRPVIQWRVEFTSCLVVPATRFLSASFSPSPPCFSFSTDIFSVRSVPVFVFFFVGAYSCTVVPVMGALFNVGAGC